MDRKRLDRIIKEEVASLLEARGGREYGINPTTGFPEEPSADEREAERRSFLKSVGGGGYDEPDEPGMEAPPVRMQAPAAPRGKANRTGMSRGKGIVTVGLNADGFFLDLPDEGRYMWLTTPAVQGQEEPLNGDSYFLMDTVRAPNSFLPGGQAGGTFVEYNREDAQPWKVIGNFEMYGGARDVGTGADVREAYMNMLRAVARRVELEENRGALAGRGGRQSAASQELARRIKQDRGGDAGPLSESRWAQLAGLMVEGKRGKSGKMFSASAESLSGEDIEHAKALGLDHKGDTLVGTVSQHRKFHKWVNATSPQAADPFDPDELDPVDEGAPHGKGAAPGSYRPPASPDPKKSGPPGKEDLEKIPKAGPFEGRHRR
jgi:hypothetical protein